MMKKLWWETEDSPLARLVRACVAVARGAKAAERQEQEKQIATAWEAAREWCNLNSLTVTRAESAEAEVAELRAAITEADGHIGLRASRGTQAEIRRVLRAALEPPPGQEGTDGDD